MYYINYFNLLVDLCLIVFFGYMQGMSYVVMYLKFMGKDRFKM